MSWSVARDVKRRLEFHPNKWMVAIALLWVIAASWPQLVKGVPGGFWLTVESVHVHDAPHGIAPRMSVSRTIHHDFTATWIAEVEQETSFGFVVLPQCTGTGTQNYRTENRLPERLDLDWWTFPVKCRPEPGRYRVDTSWTLSTGQVIRQPSNIFTVY